MGDAVDRVLSVRADPRDPVAAEALAIRGGDAACVDAGHAPHDAVERGGRDEDPLVADPRVARVSGVLLDLRGRGVVVGGRVGCRLDGWCRLRSLHDLELRDPDDRCTCGDEKRRQGGPTQREHRAKLHTRPTGEQTLRPAWQVPAGRRSES